MKTPILTESELEVFQEPQSDDLLAIHTSALRNVITGESQMTFANNRTFTGWNGNVIQERRAYTVRLEAQASLAYFEYFRSRNILPQAATLKIPDAPLYQLMATVNGIHRLSPSTNTAVILRFARDVIALQHQASDISHRYSVEAYGLQEFIFIQRFP